MSDDIPGDVPEPTQPGEADLEPIAPQASPAPAVTPPATRTGFRVPTWLAALVAALALVGLGFAIGWIAAPRDDDHHARVGLPAMRGFRGAPGFGDPGDGRPGGDAPGYGMPDGRRGQLRANAAFLGVSARDATGGKQGAQIMSVASASPADKAGLKVDDVITAVDENAVTSAADLSGRILSRAPGDKVTIAYTRNGTSAQAKVELGNRSAAIAPSPTVTVPTTSAPAA